MTDVEPDKVGDAYLALDDAITGLIKLEILGCTNELKQVNDGLTNYCREVLKNQAEIGDGIEKSLNRLTEF